MQFVSTSATLISTYSFFFLVMPPPPLSTLFPYTTLFRSLIFFSLTSMVHCSSCCALDWMKASEAALPSLIRSEEHTSELQSPYDLVCRLLLEKKKYKSISHTTIIKVVKQLNSLQDPYTYS